MALFNIFKKKKEEAGPEEQVSRQQELNEGLKKTKEGIFGKLARAVAGPGRRQALKAFVPLPGKPHYSLFF